ncbi:MAG: acetylornithine transaminase [Deltaproteobacteria bacterium]|nr:acetylornithine transaminase [Deltaproteobacteria bacterium]
MADTNALLALAGRHLLKTYKQPPLVMTRGEGCRLYDTDGRSYLDLYAGIAVCVLGHAHPALVRALTEQASRLGHIANLYYNDKQIELAAQLCARTGMDRVFFTNSGTEANEGALKLSRRWFFTQGDPERTGIVATWSSFHGRTMGSVAMTGTPKYWEGFGHRLPGVSQVKYGDLDAMRRRVNDRTAAIIIEPVQGEGGVLPAPPGYLQGLRALCDETGALLIVDEIQTGIGRSGRYLAVQHEGVVPDVLTLAKGLAGGVPIGAFLVREKYAEALAPGTHGSTFGGNPLACAAALAVLETLDREGLIEGAAAKGAYFLSRLEGLAAKHPALVKGARGRGLLCGLVLADHVEARLVLAAMRDRGVLIAQAGDRVLRFAPPLVITEAELDEGLAALDAVLTDMTQETT